MSSNKTITLNGHEFTVTPLNWETAERLEDVVNGTRKPTLTEMGDIVFAGIERDNPEMTRQELVRDYLDVENIHSAVRIVMGISGVEEKAPGEA
jgi:hypothetical protein